MNKSMFDQLAILDLVPLNFSQKKKAISPRLFASDLRLDCLPVG